MYSKRSWLADCVGTGPSSSTNVASSAATTPSLVPYWTEIKSIIIQKGWGETVKNRLPWPRN